MEGENEGLPRFAWVETDGRIRASGVAVSIGPHIAVSRIDTGATDWGSADAQETVPPNCEVAVAVVCDVIDLGDQPTLSGLDQLSW